MTTTATTFSSPSSAFNESSKLTTSASSNSLCGEDEGAFMYALKKGRVEATVIDLDHYRIRGGVAVETDYIVSVEPLLRDRSATPGSSTISLSSSSVPFEPFKISKTYSAFRRLCQKLRTILDKRLLPGQKLSPEKKTIIRWVQSIVDCVESQKTRYLSKVNYSYVKSMAQQRSQILNDALETLLEHYPQIVACAEEEEKASSHIPPTNSKKKKQYYSTRAIVRAMTKLIQTFFLTDHIDEDEFPVHSSTESSALTSTPMKRSVSGNTSPKQRKTHSPPIQQPRPLQHKLSSPVIPLTRKSRRSIVDRQHNDKILQQMGVDASLFMEQDDDDDSDADDDTEDESGHQSSLFSLPMSLAIGFYLLLISLRFASKVQFEVDADIGLLIMFSCFCAGLHMAQVRHSAVITVATGSKTSLHQLMVTPPSTPPGVKSTRRQPSRFEERTPSSPQKAVVASQPSTPIRPALDASASSSSKKRRVIERSASFIIKRSLALSSARASSVGQRSDDETSQIVTEQVIVEEEEGDPLLMAGKSPLPQYPADAELGIHLNCWSQPKPTDFMVRGGNYFVDRKKIPSGPFLFPARGADLFLTDACPENVGSISGVLGGQLRKKPSFLINFRLPWGVLIFYFEIPKRFLPFLRQRFEFDYDGPPPPKLDKMTPGDRAACRFLAADEETKNNTLKIVPVVVKGPWIVKSVVGGKPAILGTKLPVTYFYERPTADKALYLEADLDIVASSAARGMLSVCRSHTQSLTLDLGFVVQGNTEDELPEQMLVAIRCHGIDPLHAPPLPPMKNAFLHSNFQESTSDF